jgi:hypothetical protein
VDFDVHGRFLTLSLQSKGYAASCHGFQPALGRGETYPL